LSRLAQRGQKDAKIAWIATACGAPGVLGDARKKAGLTQAELAKKLGEYQSFVARLESGQRRVDLVEFLELADALGFTPGQATKRLRAVRR
jgi:transcriptional regulator with XRE-family HTH domain